jgi:short subunit dehydrogenase-like uncharacterized protein
MIYGATGYTGKLIAQRATLRGLDLVVAGRDAAKVQVLGKSLAVESRVFGIEDAVGLRDHLAHFACVINVAGPFSRTAAAVMAACIDRSVHYLDTTGETDVFLHAADRDAEARAAGVMLMPGVGWDVLPSDCVALHVAERVGKVETLRIAIAHLNATPSRGSLRTSLEMAEQGLIVRKNGRLLRLAPPLEDRTFRFGDWSASCAQTTRSDVVTAWKSTGAPNIEVYRKPLGENSLAMPEGGVDAIQEGPTPAQNAAWRAFASAEAIGENGEVARAVIEADSAYLYTARAAVEIARRVLDGDFQSGFQSPASAYGVSLPTQIGGTIRDLH